MTNKTFLLGSHVSVAQGLEKAFLRGESIGCTAIQIFTKSNRQWLSKPITENEARLFRERFTQSKIKSIVAHASYLINIGSGDIELNKKSFHALLDEVNRCKQLNINSLILHPGSSQKLTEKECLDLIADNLNEIFSITDDTTKILLENTAGMGTSVGHKFEQLAYILNRVKSKERIGICFDTCHAFAAGYDFRSEDSYEKMWKEFDTIIGIPMLKAFHLNDSKKNCGSKVDRHTHIGKGEMGLNPFRFILNDERFLEIPKILETPIDKLEDFIPDLITLVNLISPKNKKLIQNTSLEQYLE